jgi:hypothetical protein
MFNGDDFSRHLVNGLVAVLLWSVLPLGERSVSNFLHNAEAPCAELLEDLVLTCHRAFCRHVAEQQDKIVESLGAIERESHVGARCERMDCS